MSTSYHLKQGELINVDAYTRLRTIPYWLTLTCMVTKHNDSQRIGIQLSYKFNATKSKYKGTGAGQSEKSRL